MDYRELRRLDSSHGSHRDRDRLLQNESDILSIKTSSRNLDHMANKFSTVNTNNCRATYYSTLRSQHINDSTDTHGDGDTRNRHEDYKMDASHLVEANNESQHHQAPQTSATNNNPTIGYYELKKTLGKGNFSTVKLAQHKRTGHLVAIKVVKTSVLNEDNLLKVHREIDVLKKLEKHPHIVRLYQVVKTKRYLMLVTEYCSNGELYEYLVDKGKLSEAKSCDYFLQILSAVEYLHKHNVVHRDLKAENLLLTEDFTTIKIADFGFANYFTRDKLLDTWCGSPPYAAPELFKGEQYVGPPADIWSLGVILYVMVCGSLPFDGSNLLDLKRRVLSGKFRSPIFMSFECENLVRQILRLKPEKRFSISQIKAHHWIFKFSKDKNGENNPKQSSSFTSQASSKSNPHAKMLGEDIEKNRGKSLDLDDVKQNEVSTTNNEDTSMLCLNEGGKYTPEEKKACKIKSFVDDEMANAVSNMSLDSNNSSMSVSQSQDTNTLSNLSGLSTTCKSRASNRPDSAHSCSRRLSKESSIDDQIIKFLVNDLKVADNEASIRDSIANRKFDGLHAMYRLLHDQPKMMFEAQAVGFKIPFLPVLPVEKQHDSSRPSITRGFIDVSRVEDFKGSALDEGIQCPGVEVHGQLSSHRIEEDSRPINLVTKSALDRDINYNNTNKLNSHWNIPPQLFLTPPTESRAQHQEDVVITHRKSDCGLDGGDSSKVFASGDARLSFDLTIHQLRHSSANSDNSANKLQLSHDQTHDLWDSSILDTLVALASASQPVKDRMNDSSTQGVTIGRDSCLYSDYVSPTQVSMAVESQNTTLNNNHIIVNQNQLLPNLMNPPTISSAVSMTNKHNQEETRNQNIGAVGFTPNNLVNQNCNVTPHLAMHNLLVNSPNLNLLDPNGLNTSLERRASDGLTNYSSLSGDEKKPLETMSPINLGYIPTSPSRMHTEPSSIDNYNLYNANSRQIGSYSQHLEHNLPGNARPTDKPADVIQKQPLDLTFKSPVGILHDMTGKVKCQEQDQRRGSTTSETNVSPDPKISNSTSNSPRSSIHVSTVGGYNQDPLCQTSPSSVSLTGGGPGHLLNRRKRHSLDTEYRNHYYHHPLHPHNHNNHPHWHNQQHYPSRSSNNSKSPGAVYNAINIRTAVQKKTTIPQQCPPSAPVGRPRNFSQAFTYDMFEYHELIKKQTSSTHSSHQGLPIIRRADFSPSQDRPDVM